MFYIVSARSATIKPHVRCLHLFFKNLNCPRRTEVTVFPQQPPPVLFSAMSGGTRPGAGPMSLKKRSAISKLDNAAAAKRAKRNEATEQEVQFALMKAEFAATMANKEAEVIALKAQHAAQVAALTAQNAIHENQVARQTGMFGAWGSLAVRNIEILAHKGTGIYLLVFCDLTFLDNAPLFNSIFFRL